ncbi:hypothetical protein KIPB_010636, partial [Kipferlia bialata]|eukprot:g10636.t1
MKSFETNQAGRIHRSQERFSKEAAVYGNTKPAQAMTRVPLKEIGHSNRAIERPAPHPGHAHPLTHPQDRIFCIEGLTGTVYDYDDTTLYDPLRVAEYAREIHSCMLDREERHILTETFLDDCSGIRPQDRSSLINWMVGIHKELCIPTESLWLAVSYLDHYLARKGSLRPEYLLHTGAVCILLGAKWERNQPGILELVIPHLENATDRFRTRCRCKQGPPSLDGKHQVSDLVRYTGFYLSELCFQDPTLAKYRPSRLAAACLSLA